MFGDSSESCCLTKQCSFFFFFIFFLLLAWGFCLSECKLKALLSVLLFVPILLLFDCSWCWIFFLQCVKLIDLLMI